MYKLVLFEFWVDEPLSAPEPAPSGEHRAKRFARESPPSVLSMSEFLKNNFPLLFALLLSGHGLRKRSLSPSGAFAAFIVGWAMMNVKVRAVGVSLIVFYLTGSRATKCTYYVWPVARVLETWSRLT